MKTCLSIILFLIVNGCATGQSKYLVYQLKGKVWKATDKSHKLLKIGQSLTDKESIHVATHSSVVFICENYSTITLDSNKDYSLSQYSETCAAHNSSVTADYFKFMWDELSNPETTSEADRQKYMSTNVGAVERGMPDVLIDRSLDTINNSEGNIFIRWKTILPDNRVSLAVYGNEKNGEILFSTSGNGHSVSLDSIKKYIAGRQIVYWTIKEDGKETGPRKLIRFWTREECNEYLDKLHKAFIPDRYSSEWYYMTGFYLEEDHFFAEARAFYQIAAQMKPAEKRYAATLADINSKYF